MQKTKMFPVIAFSLCVSIYACSGSDKSGKKTPNTPDALTSKEDTLSNELQCTIAVDDEKFTIPADSISTGYTFSDSSFGVTFKGISGGRLVLTLPNFFKCPCSISTGYSSINTKIAGSDEYAFRPTVELYSYPVTGMSLNNLDDDYHKKEMANNAVEISAVKKTNENTNTGWAEYLIKGRIHTTVLKNVYESAAGDKNKDYSIKGSFVIQTKIYF